MQRDVKTTKITVRDDWPVSIASSFYGANIDSIAFNSEYIARRSPLALVKLMELYKECRDLLDEPILDRNDPAFTEAYDEFLNKIMNRED